MKILWLLLLTSVAVAQTTSVTIQVTDTDNQNWNNGAWTVTIYSPPGVPQGPYNIRGTSTPVPNQTQSGALSATGGASMTLTPNGSVAPGGTLWNFQVCPQAAPVPCFTQAFTILGATQSITFTPPGIRINGRNPPTTILAYQDLEISTPNIGLEYFNLTIGSSRQWNGSAWTSLGGGGVQVLASSFGTSTTPGFDNSVPLNNALVSLTAGGTVAMNAGVYTVLAPVNIGTSFTGLTGPGPANATTIVRGGTNPNFNLVQAGYNSNTCVHAYGSVTVGGGGTTISTPVANVLAAAGTVSATSTFNAGTGLITATFSATFGGATGIIPTPGETIAGSGFTPAGYNSLWTVISSTSTTVTAYQSGGGAIGNSSVSGSLFLTGGFTVTYPGGVFTLAFQGAAWNNQYVNIAQGGSSGEYQLTNFTSGSYTVTPIANSPALANGSANFAGVFSGCPNNVALQDITLDGNCGIVSNAHVPCSSGGVGLGNGIDFACRGCFRGVIRDALFIGAPGDCLYSEPSTISFGILPAYPGVTSWGIGANVFGENLRVANCGGNGFTHNGPSDGLFLNYVAAMTGGVGFQWGCVPGGLGMCGNDSFVGFSHTFNTGSWGWRFLVEGYCDFCEAEAAGDITTTGAFSIDQYQDITNTANGVAIGAQWVADNIAGDCVFINSPPTTFNSTFAFANNINGLNCAGISVGWGLHATNSPSGAGRTQLTNVNIGSVLGAIAWSGCATWGANSSRVAVLQCFNFTTTGTPTGIDFSGSSNLTRTTFSDIFVGSFSTQLKWPTAAVASRISGLLACNNAAQTCYSPSTIPAGMLPDLDLINAGSADPADGPLMIRSGSFNFGDHGQCTMAAGTCTAQNLSRVFANTPQCGGSWTGAGALAGTLKFASAVNGGTNGVATVTPSSSNAADTAVVNWWCYGQ